MTDRLRKALEALARMEHPSIAEILRNLESEQSRTLLVKKVENLWLTKEDIKRITGPILRGTALGSALGILPGNGAVLAAFASYSIEKRVSDRPEASRLPSTPPAMPPTISPVVPSERRQ